MGRTARQGSYEYLWRYGVGLGGLDWWEMPQAAVAGNTAYVGSGSGYLFALDVENGEVRHRYAAGAAIEYAPVAADGVVYAASADGYLHALDAGTFLPLWRFRTGDGAASSPAVAGGTVYVGSNDGHVFALDAGDGEEIWRFRPDAYPRMAPAVAAGVVYVASYDGTVYALDAASGGELWRFETRFFVKLGPVIAESIVYLFAGAYGEDFVIALNAASGRELRRHALDDFWRKSPALADGVFYITYPWDYVLALDAASGEELWRFEAEFVESGPTVYQGVIYVGADRSKTLYALDAADGQVLRRYKTGSHGFNAQTVSDGVIYASGTGGHLYAFPAVNLSASQPTPQLPDSESVSEPAVPELLWQYRPEGAVKTAATVGEGIVYFGAAVYAGQEDDQEIEDSFLYALDAASGERLWRIHPGPGASFITIETMAHSAAEGALYYVAGDRVRALDAKSGSLIWESVSVEESEEARSFSLVAADGALYVRSVFDENELLVRLDALDAGRRRTPVAHFSRSYYL